MKFIYRLEQLSASTKKKKFVKVRKGLTDDSISQNA